MMRRAGLSMSTCSKSSPVDSTMRSNSGSYSPSATMLLVLVLVLIYVLVEVLVISRDERRLDLPEVWFELRASDCESVKASWSYSIFLGTYSLLDILFSITYSQQDPRSLVHCCTIFHLRSGLWNRWSIQIPKGQYRDHLVGQLTTRPQSLHCLSGEPRFKKKFHIQIKFFCHCFGGPFPKMSIFKTSSGIFLRKNVF